VTIKAPTHVFGMVQFDIGMFIFQFPSLGIHFHARMTIAAGEYPRR
jgi:hypothetical protein